MASGGPISTPDQKEAFLTAVRHGAADLWRLELAEENMALEIDGKLKYVELKMKRIVTILARAVRQVRGGPVVTACSKIVSQTTGSCYTEYI